jgi:GDPmannose 4,6-dehydratase
MKKAIITGISGQDGSYLAEFLLNKGYEVHGLVRRASTFNTERLDHIYQDIHERDVKLYLHYADMTDTSRLLTLLAEINPDEVYNLAAQSHVAVSFLEPEMTGEVSGLTTTKILEAIRMTNIKCKFYQASTSELFGNSPAPQNESTPFSPQSPYAAAKLYAHTITRIYREAFGLYACAGILFNHESPRRGETFVTRKITRAVARIYLGLQDKLYLGNLDAVRDWGFAPEYVEAMWLMLQEDVPRDYVIATGFPFTVRQFCESAFASVGLNWEKYVFIDPRYLRPSEVHTLIGDATQAEIHLKWRARVYAPELADIMVKADLELLTAGKTIL